VETGYPDVRIQPLWGGKNLATAALVVAVPIPAIAAAWALFHGRLTPVGALDAWLLDHPIWAANLFFFVFVDVAFWLVALVQRSTWLIDPYWTLLPLLLAGFYTAHPQADGDPTRMGLAWFALLVWSVRLTHNYLRRERWRFGLREDWRYAKMRRGRPGFWWEQFFVVHLAQHAMLVGLTLPFWAIAFRPKPVGAPDLVCLAGAMLGLAIAHAADSRLDRFMRENQRRERRGLPRVWLLDAGIWRYSRHPNYFGEQLFWWSVAGFGWIAGEPWVAVGTLLNSIVLAAVTVMTERRMRDVPERRDAYDAYRRRTSVWVPWPPRPSVDA
jgi:steroid 5-alpha reductase family enzyme